MKNFRRFALFTTIATYFLIFVGGLVRVSGAGLGCPDWPRCFGRWIPPTAVDQLPADMDPAQFNFVLAWIEYINRLIGVFVGFLIAATAIWALKSFRKYPRIVIPAVAAAILTAIQGWQGSVVISSQLEPFVVTVHMALALVIVSLLIYVTQEAHYRENADAYPSGVWPGRITRLFGVLWIIAVVQIAIGTQIRSSLEVLMAQFPLLSSAEWLVRVGALNHVHTALGLLLAVLSWAALFSFWKFRDRLTALGRQSLLGMIVIINAQLVMGLLFIVIKLTPVVQVFHLWLASMYVGITLFLYTFAKRGEMKK